MSSGRERGFWENERKSASASYRRGSPLKSSTANSLPVNGSCTVFQAYGGRPDAANLRSVERGCEALSSLAAGRAGTAPRGNRPRAVPARPAARLESASHPRSTLRKRSEEHTSELQSHLNLVCPL